MSRHEAIKRAYKKLAKEAAFYDGMITCSTLPGRAVCRLVWDMDRKDNDRYLKLALSGIPKGFSGRMLEVPVGTGVLTMPVYESIPNADVTCLDYSTGMMKLARQRAKKLGLPNVRFIKGNVGKLPMKDRSFDLVLSLNGFHAFPDKEAAYDEIFRVLKPGGIFCGCFYIKGENCRTDWMIRHFYVPSGFFTPPFETEKSLRSRLEKKYEKVQIRTVGAMASFVCRKAEK